MGNGAMPHGPSYRAHPRLYHSGPLALGDEASYAVVLNDVTPYPANNPIMIIVRDKISAPKIMRSQQA